MREYDLMVDGEGAEHMRGLAVGESVETLPQRLSVDGDEAGRRGGTGAVETFRMTTKRLLEFIGVELLHNPAHGGVGWRSTQRSVRESRIEQGKPDADQGMNLPIRPSAAQHGEDRKEDYADLVVYFPFGATPIRDGGKARCKIDGRHEATSDSGRSPWIQTLP